MNTIPHTPHTCVAELTLACTRGCRHCASGCRPGGGGGELPAGFWTRAVGELKTLGCRRLILSGGEALLYPAWREVAAEAARAGLPCGLISNGDLIDGGIAGELASLATAGVALSLDGFRAEHDALRGPGSYQSVLAAAELLAGQGVPLALITTVHTGNIDVLAKMPALVAAIGARAWQVQLAMPAGNMARQFAPTSSDILAAGDVLAAARERGLNVSAGDCFAVDPTGRLPAFGGCQAGSLALGISHDGWLLPCLSVRDEAYRCGRLTETSLAELWTTSPVLNALRSRGPSPDERCSRCSHNPVCRGGCLSSSLSHSGRPFIGASCHHHAKETLCTTASIS